MTVIGVFLAVIQFLAFNGLCYRAELPGDASLTVEFFLSFLAQFPLGDKSGHEHHLPSDGAGGFYHFLRFFSMSVVGCERRGTPGNLAFPAKIRWD